MDKEKIIQCRAQLKEFFKNSNKVFVFEVNCDIKERIEFIYSIIFPGFQKIKFYLFYFIARVAQYIDYSPIKVFLYRLTGMKIGRGVFIAQDVILDPHFPSLINIEDYSIIGWGAKLFTHEFSGMRYRIGRINIQEGAVIGAFSTIRGGVTVEKMAETPYGSIVYKDVPAQSKPSQVLTRRLKENA